MSELNFTHSNGNKVKLTTPDTLDANKTFKLPGADGSAGEFLKTDGSGALSFATPSGTGLILIEHKDVAIGSAASNAFHFNNCFSSSYHSYVVYFTIKRGNTTGNVLAVQFGNTGNGSVITSGITAKGANRYEQLGDSGGSSKQYYNSTTGLFQLNGTLNTGGGIQGFGGVMHITDPIATDRAVFITTEVIMSQGSNNNKWREMGGASHNDGEAAAFTDLRITIPDGSSGGSNIDATSTSYGTVYGHASIYGVT